MGAPACEIVRRKNKKLRTVSAKETAHTDQASQAEVRGFIDPICCLYLHFLRAPLAARARRGS